MLVSRKAGERDGRQRRLLRPRHQRRRALGGLRLDLHRPRRRLRGRRHGRRLRARPDRGGHVPRLQQGRRPAHRRQRATATRRPSRARRRRRRPSSIAYESEATDIAPGDTSGNGSIYRRSLARQLLHADQPRRPAAAGANADSRAPAHRRSPPTGRRSPSTPTPPTSVPGTTTTASTCARGRRRRQLGSAHNHYAVAPAISADGHYLTWVDESGADAPGGDPDLRTVLGRAWPGGATELVSRPPGDVPFLARASDAGSGGPGSARISADGRYVVFEAFASRLTGSAGTADRAPRHADGRGRRGRRARRAPTARSPPAASATRPSAPTARASPSGPSRRSIRRHGRTTTPPSTSATSRPAPRSSPRAPTGRAGRSRTGTPTIRASPPTAGTWSSARDAANLGVPAGDTAVAWRDLEAGVTKLVSRADGADGALAADAHGTSVSGDGRLVVFDTMARRTSTPPTPARAPTPTCSSATRRRTRPGSSRAGRAPTAPTRTAPPRTASSARTGRRSPSWRGLRRWRRKPAPGRSVQVVLRDLATGENTLVSRAPGGAAADEDADDPALDAAGATVAFESDRAEPRPGRAANDRSVFVRAAGSGAITRLPGFGFDGGGTSAPSRRPSATTASAWRSPPTATTPSPGRPGDFRTTYVYVVSGAVRSRCRRRAVAEPRRRRPRRRPPRPRRGSPAPR